MTTSASFKDIRRRPHLMALTLGLCGVFLFSEFRILQSVAVPEWTVSIVIGYGLFIASYSTLLLITAAVIAEILVVACFRPISALSSNTSSDGSVALLLCTRDDFQSDVAASCLKALRDQDHLYLCDDSQSPDFRTRVDEFAQRHSTACSVLRRGTTAGWKGGNLNHALRAISREHAFFLIADHDNFLPAGIVTQGLTHFGDPGIAYVQFQNMDASPQPSFFATDLGSHTTAAWWLFGLREKLGFPLCVGHSVIFRRQMVEQLGGFSEQIVTEDIELAMRIHNAGYRGRYDTALQCSENTPESYRRYISRYARWCNGTLKAWISPRSRLSFQRVPLPCYFDACLFSLKLLYFVPVLGFLLGSALVGDPLVHALRTDVASKIIYFLSLVMPSIPVLLTSTSALKGIRSAAVNISLFLSMIVAQGLSLINVLHPAPVFVNTGNKSEETAVAAWVDTSTPLVMILEIALGVFLAGQICPTNPYAIPLAAAALSAPFFRLFDWSQRIVALIKPLPALSILSIFFFN